jgi:hypothetical protein
MPFSAADPRAAWSAYGRKHGLTRARIHRALGFTNLVKARARLAEVRAERRLAKLELAPQDTGSYAQAGKPQQSKGLLPAADDRVVPRWSDYYKHALPDLPARSLLESANAAAPALAPGAKPGPRPGKSEPTPPAAAAAVVRGTSRQVRKKKKVELATMATSGSLDTHHDDAMTSLTGLGGKLVKVCEWCGVEYEQAHEWGGGSRAYCSGRCRTSGYQDGKSRGEWLLMRILSKAYTVIAENRFNFDLEVPREGYPGRAAVGAEWKQMVAWAEKFLVDTTQPGVANEVVGSNGVEPYDGRPTEQRREEEDTTVLPRRRPGRPKKKG